MITSVQYISEATSIAITTDDGTVWHDDTAHPADTALRVDLSAWIAAGGVIRPYAPPTADIAVLKAYAAAKRWSVQTGGVVVSGVSVDTSDASRSMIADAVAYVEASGTTSVDFKAASGWVTISAAEMTAIGLAVGAHVQACFAAERAVDAAIAAGTITTVTAIDGWVWPPV